MGEPGVYRKVYVRMWGDARVRRLSPMPPSGQSLWAHLLCGEQTGPIPGVFKIGESAFAEQLGWSLEAFREAFLEAFREGLVKADWKSRLVWVPKALKWNPPSSPNVIRNWAGPWDLIPECVLKSEIYQSFKAFVEAMGEGFAKAFREAFRESVSSEQGEENREQLPLVATGDSLRSSPPPNAAKKPAAVRGAIFVDEFSGKEFLVQVTHTAQNAWLEVYGAELVRKEIGKAKVWLAANPGRTPKNGNGMGQFLSRWLNRASEDDRRRQPVNRQPADQSAKLVEARKATGEDNKQRRIENEKLSPPNPGLMLDIARKIAAGEFT